MLWLAAHWTWITAVTAALSGILGWYMRLWRTKEEIEKVKAERLKLEKDRQNEEYRLNILACAEWIHFKAHNEKIRAGFHDVLFSEDEIYGWTQNHGMGQFTHPALLFLREKGLAKESDMPGEWYIDLPSCN